jgi:hypothetical protein
VADTPAGAGGIWTPIQDRVARGQAEVAEMTWRTAGYMKTHADRVIGDALKQVNPNRVGVAHRKHQAAAETKLRRDVGSQMWLIIGALKEIDKSP